MSKDLLDELFPIPEGPSPRRPRFGRLAASPAMPLPTPTELHSGAAERAPWRAEFKSPDLGLSVYVGERDGRVWAYADCTDRTRLGQEVVLSLFGSDEGRTLAVRIKLDVEEADGCSGALDLGPLPALLDRLGSSCTVEAFVLE